MDTFQAILLGLLQGLTEFLPISSTGHLVLFSNFFNISSNLSFDAFIHLGSFLAIIIYFKKDLKEAWDLKSYIFLSILPGGIAGLTLEHLIESYFRTPLGVAFFLFIMTIPMYLGEKWGEKRLTIRELSYGKAFLIGLAQALALLPGTSRSGITISAGLLLGLKREEAARYSFLAGAPLILGAGLFEALKLYKYNNFDLTIAFSGLIASAISSFLAITFLIPFLKKHSLNLFILYRLILSLAIFLVILLKF
ncbi:MAG: undecaprenyl-diphosphate phosphatase [Caldimicrobium sp.]